MKRYKEEIERDEIFKNADVELSDDNTKLKVVTEEGYTFKITKDKVEYVGNNVEIEEPDLQEGEITFSYNPSTPTKSSVEVTIETKTELGNNWIEYSVFQKSKIPSSNQTGGSNGGISRSPAANLRN